MLGKVIILVILAMLGWAGFTKLARKLGLPTTKKLPVPPQTHKPLLTKFNLIIAGLIALYAIWGAIQIFS